MTALARATNGSSEVGQSLAGLALTENQVDVWRIDLARIKGGVERYRYLLSADEVERADRFRFQKHQQKFIVARAAMRQILGQYLSLPPQKLAFNYGAKGKPELADGLAHCGIRFNLSHSGEVALLAVTQGLTVGVDVEFIDSKCAGQDIAQLFFSESEVCCLQALPSTMRVDAFFACWTRKEAYLKALGEGFSLPLNSFDVAFGPSAEAALLNVRVDPGEVARWSMYDIKTPEGYKAALVVEGKKHHLSAFEWPAEHC